MNGQHTRVPQRQCYTWSLFFCYITKSYYIISQCYACVDGVAIMHHDAVCVSDRFV
jgi:hypothetical protein